LRRHNPSRSGRKWVTVQILHEQMWSIIQRIPQFVESKNPVKMNEPVPNEPRAIRTGYVQIPVCATYLHLLVSRTETRNAPEFWTSWLRKLVPFDVIPLAGIPICECIELLGDKEQGVWRLLLYEFPVPPAG
jgi:hypothetical protein